MKIFISADIEGVNNILTWDETELKCPEYNYFRKQMIALPMSPECFRFIKAHFYFQMRTLKTYKNKNSTLEHIHFLRLYVTSLASTPHMKSFTRSTNNYCIYHVST